MAKTKDLILVIDDQPNNLKVIASILAEDYTLSFSNSSDTALKMLEKGTPDLILLDVMMPGMDSYQVCEQIKQFEQLRPIPIIFISAKSNIEDIIRAFKCGAVDYITKPFHALEVKIRVKNQLAFHNALRQKEKAEAELKQNQALLQSVLQSQMEMICRFNRQAEISFANRAFMDFFVSTHEKIDGVPFYSLFPGTNKAEFNAMLNELIEKPNEIVTFQKKVFSSSGIKKWQEWRIYAIMENQEDVTEFQCIGYDITDLIERQQLEKEVEIARNTLKFKQNFLASMSHEIRTPLMGILGSIELMSSTHLDYNQKGYLETLSSSSESLRTIIDQVLDYARIESGNIQLQMTPYDPEQILLHAGRIFKSVCRKPLKFVTKLSPELPNYIIFDSSRIKQIVNNLIINAVKFTEDGEVGISIFPEYDNSDTAGELMIRIEVTDTGIGIHKNRQANLFSPFSQVHTIHTENYTGLGLGLSICKEIANLHGGDIGIISTPGQGSTVWFTFRATKEKEDLEENDDYEGWTTGNEFRRLNILYAEDKVTTQKIVKIILNSMGHNVTLANNGQEAIEATNPDSFDLILMDIQMPVLDGLSATRIIKSRYPNPPLIVGLSANVFEGDREKYISLGMDDYLRKPATRKEFEVLFDQLFFSGNKSNQN